MESAYMPLCSPPRRLGGEVIGRFLRLIPSLTGRPPQLADSTATRSPLPPMLASMNAERVLSTGEGDMAKANQVQVWALGLALLAGGEFSYAHLRRLGLWPLELMARSAWRLASMAAGTALPGGAPSVAPVALALIALAVWGIAALRKRRRASTVAPAGGDHE